MLPFAIDVTTPSLGARVSIEGEGRDARVALQVNNGSGRGAPSHWMVLPVTSADVRQMQSRINLAIEYAKSQPAFWTLHRRSVGTTLPGPYTVRYQPHEWHTLSQGHPAVLVVLIYRQHALTAEPGARRDRPQRAGDEHAQELAGLQDLFRKRDPEILRRGLVWLDPCDLPGAVAPLRPGPVSFVAASCQYPAGVLDATPNHLADGPVGPADASMRRLAERLAPNPLVERPSLLLLNGDQVYVDSTAGLFDPRRQRLGGAAGDAGMQVESLRASYESWLTTAHVALGLVSSRMTMDDHEIEDNWQPLARPRRDPVVQDNLAMRALGIEGYGRYQRDRPHRSTLAEQWRSCRHRGLRFFLADTRTERGARKASFDPLAPRIMSSRQAWELGHWLRHETGRGPRFIVSSSMLLPRRRSSIDPTWRAAIHSDAWDGYPGSLHALLALLCRAGIDNAVFLSGDEHLSSITRATVTDESNPRRRITLHSIHSSGLYAPYPFANSIAADFAVQDSWSFADPREPRRRYRCEVHVDHWAPGDGFACVTVTPPGACRAGWLVDVTFDRAPATPLGWWTVLPDQV